MEIGEFGVGRPDFGGRWPRGEALEKKRVTGLGPPCGRSSKASRGQGRAGSRSRATGLLRSRRSSRLSAFVPNQRVSVYQRRQRASQSWLVLYLLKCVVLKRVHKPGVWINQVAQIAFRVDLPLGCLASAAAAIRFRICMRRGSVSEAGASDAWMGTGSA